MNTKEKSTTAVTSTESSSTRLRRPPNTQMVQNFHLVWLDAGIDENNDDCRNSITKLRQVVNTVNTFTNVDESIDFITDVEEGQAFMIVSEAFSQLIVPVIQDISQVNSVYIFCENEVPNEKWPKKWTKVKGVYTDILSICKVLKQATHECEQNSVSVSFVKPIDGATNRNLDTLDSSFMYTQILKEILLTIDFEQKHINEFLTYCREQFAGNTIELKNVEKIEKEYHSHQPIWWYTYGCFLYSMLNKALRLMEVDPILIMGFFVRDLHNHIAALHTEQYRQLHHSESFIVYRGQGLSQTDFHQLRETQGGLLAFNSFLSTSANSDVSLKFARRTMATSTLVGILFILKIDPSISAIPFANVRKVSYFKEEEEILFSMNSVFRIRQVQQIEKNDRLWQVDLTLTGDNDPQLQVLTESMRKKTSSSYKGWHRLGKLTIKLGQFNKAEELYKILLQQTIDETEKAYLFQQLGQTKFLQGEHAETITYYERSIVILQKILPPEHPDLTASYNNLGVVYHNMGQFSKALSSHEKALEIRQKTLPANHTSLTASYNNIGLVYDKMGQYSKALSHFETALEIQQKTLPANHPSLATSYNNIGAVCNNMGEHSKAFSYYQKSLEIRQKTLPANHPSLATSYNSIGRVYNNMGEHSKALSYYEKSLEIRQKTLPANHPDLATSYNNIGSVYDNMGEYSKALSSHEKALEIRQKTLPANHPDLATSYNNIGSVYDNMSQYSKALSSHEKALEIRQITLPANHPDLATSYNNIGLVYQDMGEYLKALSYLEKALEIFEKTLPANHPSLATSYNNIGEVYKNMGEYSKALSYLERALDVFQRSLPPNHPNIKTVKESIEIVKKKF